VVVLPAPLGPKNATISPSSMEKLTFLTALTIVCSRWNNPRTDAISPSRFRKTLYSRHNSLTSIAAMRGMVVQATDRRKRSSLTGIPPGIQTSQSTGRHTRSAGEEISFRIFIDVEQTNTKKRRTSSAFGIQCVTVGHSLNSGAAFLSFPSVADLIPVLQVAVGPVILISGVGLLLLSMTNRLGRVIDRARILDRELRPGSPEDPHRNREQLRILIDRARLLRLAIVLASVSVLLAACLIISLFLATLLKLNAGALILVQFVGCLGCLICSIIEFIRDINLSLAAMKLEVCDSLQQ
jgi:hypothetical protein